VSDELDWRRMGQSGKRPVPRHRLTHITNRRTMLSRRLRPLAWSARVARVALVALVATALAAPIAAPLGAQSNGSPRTAPLPADPAADVEAVRRAALDYIEGFYEGDSTKHVRSIRPEFYKYGFYFNPNTGKYNGSQMTWPEALAFSRRVRENNRPAPADAPKEVKILEVSDQTAAVKVTAYWGIDYLLLGKYDGTWMIAHVMWQSPPPRP
jgi:Putative lumazine-binding